VGGTFPSEKQDEVRANPTVRASQDWFLVQTSERAFFPSFLPSLPPSLPSFLPVLFGYLVFISSS
jgi:hypothetical protein